MQIINTYILSYNVEQTNKDKALLSNIETTKQWCIYLHHGLQRCFLEDYSCLTDLYNHLVLHVQKLMVWCHPSIYATTEDINSSYNISNIAAGTPCGRSHVAVPQSELYIRWYLRVMQLFYINITFLRFEVLDSGTHCHASAFKMVEYLIRSREWNQRSNWRYCGHRPPWTELVQSSLLIASIHQVELRNHFNISFIYYTIEHSKYKKYENHYILYETFTLATSNVYLTMKEPDLDSITWVINVHVGFLVRFLHVQLSHPFGVLNVYDGPKKSFTLHTIMEPANIIHPDILSDYFAIFMELHLKRTNLSMIGIEILHLNYIRERAMAQRLSLSTSTTIRSRNLILHQMFFFETSNKQFPNISLEVRQLDGWNEGGCNLGGFAIVQNIGFSDEDGTYEDKFVTSGPYCPGGSLGLPFTSEYGFSSLVLNNYCYLVLYSYGSDYNIDVDIIVTISDCEGIVDPALTCPGLLATDQLDYFHSDIQRGSYKISCNYVVSLEVYQIQLYRLQSCLVVQALHHGHRFPYNLEIFSSANVQWNLKIPPCQRYDGIFIDINIVTLAWGEQVSGIHRVITMLNNRYLRLREVSVMQMRNEYKLSFYHSSLLVKIEPYEIRESTCMMMKKSSHSAVSYMGYEKALITRLACLCAVGIYSTPTLYMYSLIPRYMFHRAQTAVVYFEILDTNNYCSRYNSANDILTVTIRDIMAQSLYVGKEGVQCSVPDVTVNIIYERHEMCSDFIIQFQRYKLNLFTRIEGPFVYESFFVEVCYMYIKYLYIYISNVL